MKQTKKKRRAPICVISLLFLAYFLFFLYICRCVATHSPSAQSTGHNATKQSTSRSRMQFASGTISEPIVRVSTAFPWPQVTLHSPFVHTSGQVSGQGTSLVHVRIFMVSAQKLMSAGSSTYAFLTLDFLQFSGLSDARSRLYGQLR